MAFERNNFSVAKKVVLPKEELTVECNINAEATVQKVLAVYVEPCVHNWEVISGAISYAGAIDVKVVFLTEEGEISSVSSNCPFSSKIENDKIMMGACAVVKVETIDSSCQLSGGDGIRVSAILSQSGIIVSNQEETLLRCDDEDVCYQSEEMEVVKFLGCGQDVVSVESDINIRENIKKVLLTESKAVIKNTEAGANYVVVSGDVVSKILYINENDKFESGYIYDSFKQEVELAGVTRDSLVEGYACICQEKVETEIVQDERGCKLVVKVPVTLNAFAYEMQSISVVTDLYGTKQQINVITNSFDMSTLCGNELVEGKVEGSLVLEEDKPRVDKILFNGGNRVSVTNQYIQDGEVFVEGIAQTTVVYLNDESSSLYSVVVDVPFVISDKVACASDAALVLSPVITDVDVAVKKGRELMFDAKVKVAVVCSCTLANAVIADAVKEEEYKERDYAMEVVFARRGSGLWETAKAAKVKEEQILSQNPEVIFPVEEDTPLVLFYQKIN